MFAWRFVAMVVEICRFKITVATEKPTSKSRSPIIHEEVPLNNGGETYLNTDLPA